MSIIVDSIAAKPSMQAYSSVAGKGTRLALLMPVKDGEKVTNDVNSEMSLVIPSWVETILDGATILPIFAFKLHEV